MHDIDEIRKKSKVPTHSGHFFNLGVLILISLVVGLGYGQIQDISDFEVKPEDIAHLRLGLGIGYSVLVLVVLAVGYFFWVLKGLSRFLRAVKAQAMDDLVKTLKERDDKDKK